MATFKTILISALIGILIPISMVGMGVFIYWDWNILNPGTWTNEGRGCFTVLVCLIEIFIFGSALARIIKEGL